MGVFVNSATYLSLYFLQSSQLAEAVEMSTTSPTILRTSYKFGDYLTKPDIAKFELPKKMSRPWIVNNAYEKEKLKDLLKNEKSVETKDVEMQMKNKKTDKRKS